MKAHRLATLRFLADAMLLALIFWAPPFLTFIFGIAFLFFFAGFFEFLFAAFLLDMLYSAPIPFFGGFQFVCFVAAIALFVCVELVKKRMRFY